MGVGQGLIGLGVLMMLAADLVGFFQVFFYIVFYLGAAIVTSGVAWLVATGRRAPGTE